MTPFDTEYIRNSGFYGKSEVRIATVGSDHQVRVGLAERLHAPILGDFVYNTGSIGGYNVRIPMLMLEGIQLKNPKTKEPLYEGKIVAPPEFAYLSDTLTPKTH